MKIKIYVSYLTLETAFWLLDIWKTILLTPEHLALSAQ